MLKFNKILILLIIIVLLVAALGVALFRPFDGLKQSYFAVYLNTGDLYFGQLHRFPTLSLSDVWFIQRNAQDTDNPFTLVKFEQTFWKPESKIYLNEKDIVWKARLQADSPILSTIKNQNGEAAKTSQ